MNTFRANADFATTHWTAVLTAGRIDEPRAHAALQELCLSYWYPLYAYVRRQGREVHEAEDLTQEFFARLLAKNGLASVRPEHGRFRSFLLASMKNFLANERERAQAQRRGGGRPVVSLDGLNGAEAETRYALEPADPLTPEAVFERRWAFAVLERTLAQLRHEYDTDKKRELHDQLQGFLPCGHGSASRADLAAKRGVSVGAIDVAIHRLRQRFGALLREQVAQTVSSEAEVEDEIRHLIAVLGA